MSEGYQCDMCKECLPNLPYVIMSAEHESYDWCEPCYMKFTNWNNEQSKEK